MGIVVALTLPLLALAALQAAINLNASAHANRFWLWLLRPIASFGQRWRRTLNMATVAALVAWTLCSGAAAKLVDPPEIKPPRAKPNVTNASATSEGRAITLRYTLNKNAKVELQVLAMAGERVLREVALRGKEGRNKHRFRAVDERFTPRLMTLRLRAVDNSESVSSTVTVPVRRE